MASTGRVHISLSYGNYEKELVNLKALLQQTLEEIKACCISQHPKSDDLGDPDASTSNQASGDLLENVNEMEPEIVKAHDRRTATTMEEGFSNGIFSIRHSNAINLTITFDLSFITR